MNYLGKYLYFIDSYAILDPWIKRRSRPGVLAALSVSILLAQDQPNPHWAFAQPQAKKPALPTMMHLCIAGCSTGKGGTLVFENGRYADKLAPTSVYTIETFMPERVVIHLDRQLTKEDPYGGTAILSGQLSKDGNSIVNGTIKWTSHPCCGLTTGPFRAAWGDAIGTVPGNPNEGNVQASSAQDQSRTMLSFLFSVIGGGGQDNGDAGSGLTGRIATLKDELDRAQQRCAAHQDNQCSDGERLKGQLSDAESELVSEILQLQEAHKTLDPECKNGNQDSCGKLAQVDALLKKDQEFRVRDMTVLTVRLISLSLLALSGLLAQKESPAELAAGASGHPEQDDGGHRRIQRRSALGVRHGQGTRECQRGPRRGLRVHSRCG